jgi:hypothetical protein
MMEFNRSVIERAVAEEKVEKNKKRPKTIEGDLMCF